MNLGHLSYFREVAKHRSFSKAAQAMNAQQSGISRAIRALEEELGVELFERSTRHVMLTAAGHRLLAECDGIFDTIGNLANVVRNDKDSFQGYLQFGISDSLTDDVLPPVLKKLKLNHPLLIPSIATGLVPSLLQKIENQELDFGLFFTGVSRWQPFACALLAKVPFYLVVATPHRRDSQVLASHIAAREYEDRRVEENEEIRILRAVSPHAQVKISANSYSTHKALVLAGLGVSFFPEFAIREELRQKKLFILNRKFPISFDLNVISKKDRPISGGAKEALSLFQSELNLD